MSSTSTTYPLISIIVPIYNAAPYLERCCRCLHEQTYPSLEFILVDDGSTDDSGELSEQIATKIGQCRVFHIENQGASLARKFGLQQATGKYISFIDSDDYIDRSYIEQLYNLMQTHGTTISACRVQRVPKGHYPIPQSRGTTTLLSFCELMPRFLKYEFWGLYGKLYCKNVFERVTFPNATISEDYYVMSQLFLQEQQMAYTDTPLYYYEEHEGGLSHLRLSERAFEEFDNVKAVYELMQSKASQYSAMALSNVVETCLKLLSMNHQDTSQKYTTLATPLRQFLRLHLIEIVGSKAIYWKLKVLAIRWAIFTL